MPQPSPAFGKAVQQPSPKAHFDTHEPEPTDSFLRPNLASSPRPDPMSSSGSPPPSSTSNTANYPSNAAASAPSSDSDATSRFVPPVVGLVPSGADTSSMRSALEIISTTLERTEAYAALHADHAALQQAYRTSRSRVQALETELQGAAAATSPFVQFASNGTM
ncbi:unnamed protein product [Phytophthora fragariaefolia]|uniref:Unnamed protein product n=1 Tax=Phytophthora fragariaefolia TaxID=1490495 RepID=A0A9W6XI72_9STRA|nr:unnamed protein product [Phytophthora fragariaefolia]